MNRRNRCTAGGNSPVGFQDVNPPFEPEHSLPHEGSVQHGRSLDRHRKSPHPLLSAFSFHAEG